MRKPNFFWHNRSQRQKFRNLFPVKLIGKVTSLSENVRNILLMWVFVLSNTFHIQSAPVSLTCVTFRLVRGFLTHGVAVSLANALERVTGVLNAVEDRAPVWSFTNLYYLATTPLKSTVTSASGPYSLQNNLLVNAILLSGCRAPYICTSEQPHDHHLHDWHVVYTFTSIWSGVCHSALSQRWQFLLPHSTANFAQSTRIHMYTLGLVALPGFAWCGCSLSAYAPVVSAWWFSDVLALDAFDCCSARYYVHNGTSAIQRNGVYTLSWSLCSEEAPFRLKINNFVTTTPPKSINSSECFTLEHYFIVSHYNSTIICITVLQHSCRHFQMTSIIISSAYH